MAEDGEAVAILEGLLFAENQGMRIVEVQCSSVEVQRSSAMQASMFIFSYRLDFSCNVTDLICLDTEALLNEVGCGFCSRGLFKLSWLLSCQKIKEKTKR